MADYCEIWHYFIISLVLLMYWVDIESGTKYVCMKTLRGKVIIIIIIHHLYSAMGSYWDTEALLAPVKTV